MPLDLIPPDRNVRETLEALGLIWVLGYLGRVVWHMQQVKAGRRRFWSLVLVWEVPLAGFCGIAGAGLSEFLELSGWVAWAAIGVVGYLGPGGIEAMVERALRHWISGPPKP